MVIAQKYTDSHQRNHLTGYYASGDFAHLHGRCGVNAHEYAPNLSNSGAGSLERRSLLWSTIGLGMLVVIGLIGAWTLRQISDSDQWVDHTREVITQNQKLLSDIKDAESGERGYIISGDEAYLAAYEKVAQDIPPGTDNLLSLTHDNPSQQDRLKHLQELVGQRLAVLNNALHQRKQSGFEAAQKVVTAGAGRAAMEQIRDTSAQIEVEEYRLLRERSQRRQAAIRGGFIAILGASAIALFALLSAPKDVRRALRQRDQAKQAQQQSEFTTNALFESAAQSILIVDQSGRIVMANPATESMLGYRKEELLGQSIEMLVPENLRGVHVAHRGQYFRNAQTRPMGLGMDLQARRKDGAVFAAEISLSHIRSGDQTLAVAFVSDVSRRKADADALHQQKEELRALTARLMTAQDDERRRISRNLHDDLSQNLAFLAMDLGKLASNPALGSLAGDVRPLQLRAVDAAENVRQISHQLHPSVLDDIGLDAALEQYCEEFENRSGITTTFIGRNVPDALSKEISSSIYHIAQECLRNVAKHSGAKTVSVAIEYRQNLLRLKVRDEGVGLKPSGANGIGIVAMKERAHLINGQLSIQSEHGAGTEVSVEVPVEG
jgi:PAS domain S-box-containing protein